MITYTVTNATCIKEATTTINVIIPICTETITFTAPEDLCASAGIQTGLSGGLPLGGVYSGPGVSDDGNGQTYTFDPSIAGAGTVAYLTSMMMVMRVQYLYQMML